MFAMVIARRPVSGQQRSNPKYKEAIQQAARSRVGAPLDGSDLYARIVWLHRVGRGQDVDNIIKPLLDALEGIVYEDDGQISQCLAVAIDSSAEVQVSDRNVHETAYDDLLEALSQDPKHILYVEVGPVAGKRVVFGPIDAGGR